MKWIITHLLVFVCFTVAAEETGDPPVFKSSDTQSLIAKDGQKVSVRGSVSSVSKSKGGTNFIKFKDSEFYLVIFKSDLAVFGTVEPARLYMEKNLFVTGVISLYKNKPQIKLSHPDMVKIVNADAPVNKSDSNPSFDNANKHDKPVKKPATISTGKANKNEKKAKPPVDPKKYFN